MLHARRATSVYQLAVRPGSEGEFMGACCSLIRIVGDEEPGLFSGLVGSRAWLDKALRRMDQGPEGAAVVAVRMAQMGPGAIHYLMGATSNKRLDELLKVARGVWLCDVATSLTEAAAESGEALGVWAKRNAADIRGVARQVGWSTPADAGGIGKEDAWDDSSDPVTRARAVGQALNRLFDPMPMVASADPARISKDGAVARKTFRLKSMFTGSEPKWLADDVRANVVIRARESNDFPKNVADMLDVSVDGLHVTVTIRLASPSSSRTEAPPPPRQDRPGEKQMREALRIARELDQFVYLYRRNARKVMPAGISESFFSVEKAYAVAQPGREAVTVEKMIRKMFNDPSVVQKTVKMLGDGVIITIHLGKLD